CSWLVTSATRGGSVFRPSVVNMLIIRSGRLYEPLSVSVSVEAAVAALWAGISENELSCCIVLNRIPYHIAPSLEPHPHHTGYNSTFPFGPRTRRLASFRWC